VPEPSIEEELAEAEAALRAIDAALALPGMADGARGHLMIARRIEGEVVDRLRFQRIWSIA